MIQTKRLKMPAQNSFIVVNNTMYVGLQKLTQLFTVLHEQTDKQGSPPLQDRYQYWSHPLSQSSCRILVVGLERDCG